jgi:uncharacterized GH25 family protein
MFLRGLAFDYILNIVNIFPIRVLKKGHPLPILQIVVKILNLIRNSFALL